MTSGGADALKAAFRRSLPLIVGLIILGVVAVNVFEALAGSKYQASANVEISPTPLSAIVTNTTSPLVDPAEVLATAQTLAGAPQVYRIAASMTRYRYGTAGTLSNATTVTTVGSTSLLGFSATASTADAAIAIANATANAYTTYSAQSTAQTIQLEIAPLQADLATQTPAERSQTQTKIYDLNLAKASASAGASVVEAAATADKTSPKPAKDSAIGLTVGLVIALLLVALREAIDTTVRSEADVEEVLSAPVLGSVRSLPRRTQIVTLGRHEPMYGDAYALLAAQLAPDKRETQHSILAVTSAVAGEGKTTTVANLAVALAKRGEHVLLADFDFHRPTLGSLFEIPHGVAGALQILDGTASLDETLWEVSLDGPRVVSKRLVDPDQYGSRKFERSARGGARPDPGSDDDRDGVGSLVVLPSGMTSIDDARKRTTQLGPLLRDLSAFSPVVMLDTPPALMTVEMTELAQLVDMVVVVVRQGRVTQRVLRSLGRHARTWPSELTGAILTDVPAATTYGSYYGGR